MAGNTAGSTIRRLDSQADITLISQESYPEYTACALPHYLAGEISRLKLFLRTKKDYAREKIKCILGQRVTSLSPENKRVSLETKSLAYDKLILATGSRPLILPIKGVELNGVFPLKSLADAEHILGYTSHTTVVIGSGPIGIETSIALRQRGQQVCLIELINRIMPRAFDETPSSLLRSILEEQGINVLTGEMVLSIEGNGRVEGIVTNRRRIKCDMVILGSGMRPNIEMAKAAGVKTGNLGGISINHRMMTNIDDIYACGDCVETENEVTGELSLCLLWHNARRQGEVAGNNICGVTRNYPGSQNITSLNIFGTHVASFGQIAAEVNRHDGLEIIERQTGKNYYRLLISKSRLIGAQAIGDIPAMGAWLYALIKQDNLDEIKTAIDAETLPLNHWYRGAATLMMSRRNHGR